VREVPRHMLPESMQLTAQGRRGGSRVTAGAGEGSALRPGRCARRPSARQTPARARRLRSLGMQHVHGKTTRAQPRTERPCCTRLFGHWTSALPKPKVQRVTLLCIQLCCASNRRQTADPLKSLACAGRDQVRELQAASRTASRLRNGRLYRFSCASCTVRVMPSWLRARVQGAWFAGVTRARTAARTGKVLRLVSLQSPQPNEALGRSRRFQLLGVPRAWPSEEPCTGALCAPPGRQRAGAGHSRHTGGLHSSRTPPSALPTKRRLPAQVRLSVPRSRTAQTGPGIGRSCWRFTSLKGT